MTAGAVSTGNGFGAADPGCRDETLLLKLSRQVNTSTSKTAPVQIAVTEEPVVTNLTTLPGAASHPGSAVKPVQVSGAARPVVGGSSFADAAAVGPGAWSDTAALGETLFYRVPLQPGQRLRVSLQTPAPGTSSGLTRADVVAPEVRLFAPSWAQITRQYTALGAGQRRTVSATTPQIRVRNRELSTVYDRLDEASVAGDYYVAVAIDPGQANLTGQVMALRLAVAVEGRPTGLPVYAAASPTRSPTASVPSSEGATPAASTSAPSAPGGPGGGGPGWIPVAATIAVLLGLGAAVMAYRRRRAARRR